jgi:fluoride exporter
MPNLILVMFGGAIGSAARYLVGRGTTALWGIGYPWGTLTVNLVGGFLMGLLVAIFARTGHANEPLHVLLAIGVLGGFTTFSSFSLDTVNMIERGDMLMALGYVLASVIGSVLALFAALWIVRAVAA